MAEKRTIIFMVTNGAGLGHLTRGLAIARRLRALDPSLEIVFFTTSVATEVIRREGFMYFYIPTKAFLSKQMNITQWNEMVKQHLSEIIGLYHPIGIVYDGVLPYSGLLQELHRHRKLTSIWIKREGYKTGWDGIDALEDEFDYVIVPMEFNNNFGRKRETKHKRYCHPITLLDEDEAFSREEVRKAFSAYREERLFYVQLGAGNINNIQGLLEIVQSSLLQIKHARIILAESMIGTPIKPIDPDIKVLRSYPNAQYFKGFDFAISAGGYNTVNELVRFKLPALYIPNEQTQVDDQKSRTQAIEANGLGLVLHQMSSLDTQIERLVLEKRMILERLQGVNEPNGAFKAAQLVKEFIVD